MAILLLLDRLAVVRIELPVPWWLAFIFIVGGVLVLKVGVKKTSENRQRGRVADPRE